MKKNFKKIFFYVLIQSITLGSIIISFRKIRDLFPAPEISNSKIIGYAQFTGYPLYFDTFIFFLVMLSPIVICIIIQKINR